MKTTAGVHDLARNDRTRINDLLGEIERETADMGAWFTQARANEELLHATWDGQSEDGRKWSKNYGREVFPWEGCSDQRIRLIEEAIDEVSMLEVSAFFGAQLMAMAQEANDVDAAGRVQTLLNYEVKQRMRSELWREVNYASQWKNIFGHAMLHTSWTTPWTMGRETMTEAELAEMVAEARSAEVAAMGGEVDEQTSAAIFEESAIMVAEELMDSGRAEFLMTVIRQRFPTLSEKRLRNVIKQLKAEGAAEFRVPVRLPGKPCVRALTPGVDAVYPAWVDCMEEAPWIAVRCRVSEPELRAKVVTEGWDEAFVDAMIEHGPSRVLEMGTLVRNLSAQVNRVFNRGARDTWRTRIETDATAFEYLHVFLKTVDEDGYPAMQEVVLHPDISKSEEEKGSGLVGLDRLLDYWMPGSCFVDVRREFKSRGLWDTRGVPEIVESEQWQRKAITDSLMDRTALLTRPPLKVNPRRLVSNKGQADVRPGGKVPNAPGDDTDWMQPPAMDGTPIEMDRVIGRRVANLIGLAHAELPPEKVAMHQQWQVTNFLTQMREVVLRILALDQQYMDPMQVSRVIGSGPLPFQITREEIQGQYDVALMFDVRTMDAEFVKKRWEAIEKAFSLDRTGVLNDVAVTRWILASIDPNLADIAVPDVQAATADEIEEEKAAVAMMASGVEPTMKEGGQNFRVRLQTMMQTIQVNPELMALYQQGGSFAKMVEARRQHFEFQLEQQQNAVIGRVGAAPALEG